MKINWGTGLMIGMGLFIGFILFFVISMLTNKKYQHELVTEDYYQKEMLYQQEIDAEKNLMSFSEEVLAKRTKEGWILQFPKEMDPQKVEGTVFLYRPSNKQLDFDLPMVLSGSNLLIPDNRLLDGRWDITVDWIYEGERYMYKKSITY